MGSVGACWDNAVVERFFGSLKYDWIFKVTQPTRDHMWRNTCGITTPFIFNQPIKIYDLRVLKSNIGRENRVAIMLRMSRFGTMILWLASEARKRKIIQC